MKCRPSTEQEHLAAAGYHVAAAKVSQNPYERSAHLAAARQHRAAARDAAAGKSTADHIAHELTANARQQTALRLRYARVLRQLRMPGRRPTGRGRG